MNLGNREKNALDSSAKPLHRFEFMYLDPSNPYDKTAYIKKSLGSGGKLKFEGDEEVQRKYGYLMNQYPPLQRFEARYCDADVGTERLEAWLGGGVEPLFMENETVREIYGHLFGDGHIGKFKEKHLEDDGGTSKLEERLSTGIDPESLEFFKYPGIFIGSKFEVLFAKYELRRFEKKYLDPDGGTSKLKNALRDGGLELWRGLPVHVDVREKYGELAARYALEIFERTWLRGCDDEDEAFEMLRGILETSFFVIPGECEPQVHEK